MMRRAEFPQGHWKTTNNSPPHRCRRSQLDLGVIVTGAMPLLPAGHQATARARPLTMCKSLHTRSRLRKSRPSSVQTVSAIKSAVFDCDLVPILTRITGTGDFYPWRGTHPEDALTEQTAKQGYFDHVQVSQNESNTARPSLYAHLKHRSGLKILSSVFAVALEKSHTKSKVSASSTFKPPPRVTLTDMKREAWLRDLANPTVPLRKLSRTIPHGIRGKSLLDQCLNKSIPTARALWLAKCVGANEIRAFKRKGTSPAAASGLESKWVRDWTANVIQFLESVIGGCGVEGWRNHLNYA